MPIRPALPAKKIVFSLPIHLPTSFWNFQCQQAEDRNKSNKYKNASKKETDSLSDCFRSRAPPARPWARYEVWRSAGFHD